MDISNSNSNTNGTYMNKSNHNTASFSFSATSQRDVIYRCGSCGYDLNLSSSARNTSTIGSKYDKSIKSGMISFFCVDESRFTQVEVFQCVPYFISKHLWGLFHRKTKLLCRKCNNHIGDAYNDAPSSYPLVTEGSDSASGSENSSFKKYDIRIRAVQPSSSMEPDIPLV
ncbi:uncharacterized protein At4g08330, chloroplastic [Rutidosis leptorrhynchoides]|uniref:uncharacterized protein At4g08330, chloroplastic n=1 Tax=Rutidosis leptorrhynchoides TaxID=125765 RepID=UPI003A995129